MFSVKLQNVRSHREFHGQFMPGHHLLSGPSGSGKSSVMIASYFAIRGLVKHGDTGYKEMDVVNESEQRTVKVHLTFGTHVIDRSWDPVTKKETLAYRDGEGSVAHGSVAQSIIDRILPPFVMDRVVFTKLKDQFSMLKGPDRRQLLDNLVHPSLERIITVCKQNVLASKRKLEEARANLIGSGWDEQFGFELDGPPSQRTADTIFGLLAKHDMLTKELSSTSEFRESLKDIDRRIIELDGSDTVERLEMWERYCSEKRQFEDTAISVVEESRMREAIEKRALRVDTMSLEEAMKRASSTDTVECAGGHRNTLVGHHESRLTMKEFSEMVELQGYTDRRGPPVPSDVPVYDLGDISRFEALIEDYTQAIEDEDSVRIELDACRSVDTVDRELAVVRDDNTARDMADHEAYMNQKAKLESECIDPGLAVRMRAEHRRRDLYVPQLQIDTALAKAEGSMTLRCTVCTKRKRVVYDESVLTEREGAEMEELKFHRANSSIGDTDNTLVYPLSDIEVYRDAKEAVNRYTAELEALGVPIRVDDQPIQDMKRVMNIDWEEWARLVKRDRLRVECEACGSVTTVSRTTGEAVPCNGNECSDTTNTHLTDSERVQLGIANGVRATCVAPYDNDVRVLKRIAAQRKKELETERARQRSRDMATSNMNAARKRMLATGIPADQSVDKLLGAYHKSRCNPQRLRQLEPKRAHTCCAKPVYASSIEIPKLSDVHAYEKLVERKRAYDAISDPRINAADLIGMDDIDRRERIYHALHDLVAVPVPLGVRKGQTSAELHERKKDVEDALVRELDRINGIRVRMGVIQQRRERLGKRVDDLPCKDMSLLRRAYYASRCDDDRLATLSRKKASRCTGCKLRAYVVETHEPTDEDRLEYARLRDMHARWLKLSDHGYENLLREEDIRVGVMARTRLENLVPVHRPVDVPVTATATSVRTRLREERQRLVEARVRVVRHMAIQRELTAIGTRVELERELDLVRQYEKQTLFLPLKHRVDEASEYHSSCLRVENCVRKVAERHRTTLIQEIEDTMNDLLSAFIQTPRVHVELREKNTKNSVSVNLIRYRNGNEMNGLSHGENDRVNMAGTVALARVVGAPFLFLDEVQAHLDGPNLLSSCIPRISEMLDIPTIHVAHQVSPDGAIDEGFSSVKEL